MAGGTHQSTVLHLNSIKNEISIRLCISIRVQWHLNATRSSQTARTFTSKPQILSLNIFQRVVDRYFSCLRISLSQYFSVNTSHHCRGQIKFDSYYPPFRVKLISSSLKGSKASPVSRGSPSCRPEPPQRVSVCDCPRRKTAELKRCCHICSSSWGPTTL